MIGFFAGCPRRRKTRIQNVAGCQGSLGWWHGAFPKWPSGMPGGRYRRGSDKAWGHLVQLGFYLMVHSGFIA